MSQFHELTVASVKQLTPSSVKITFHIPDDLSSDFNFKAGQYLSLKTSINGETIIRDYSICSSPSSGELSVGVKMLSGGIFSTYAQRIKAGDRLLVRSPQGKFILDEPIQTFVGIAAGSGITPIMSLLQAFLENGSDRNAILIYGNKTPEDTLFFNELKALKNTYGDRLEIKWVFSRIDMPETSFGRINTKTINSLISSNSKLTKAHFYLCGPNDMVQDVKSALIGSEVSEDHIKFELFFVANSTETPSEASSGKTSVEMVLDGETVSFDMDQSQFVLDAALDQDLDAPYSCRGGVCSSCIAKVVSGSAEMAQNNVLSDADLDAGYILTCQARPTSLSITIDYDDV